MIYIYIYIYIYNKYHFLIEYNDNYQISFRFTFFTGGDIKLQKMHFFGQFKDYNSGRKHGS